MKKIGIFFGISLALISACGRKEAPKPAGSSESEAKEQALIEYYTCPMHPQIHREGPGNCPICGMTLVPVYSTKGSSHSHAAETMSQKVSGRGEVELDEARRQWIGLKVDVAEKRKLRREIAASARIASDPDLLVAQADYLAARRTGGGELGGLQSGLVAAAKNRLLLLGMDEAGIAELGRRSRPQLGLLLPAPGEALWIYASVFETDLPWIHPGMGAELDLPGGDRRSLSVDSVSPIVDPATRTATLRLRLDSAPASLKPGMFLLLRLKSESEANLVVPSEALIETGAETLVFVERAPGSYEPRKVQVGRRGSDEVEILGGLSEGERIVTRGNFLVDSESRLRSGGGGSK